VLPAKNRVSRQPMPTDSDRHVCYTSVLLPQSSTIVLSARGFKNVFQSRVGLSKQSDFLEPEEAERMLNTNWLQDRTKGYCAVTLLENCELSRQKSTRTSQFRNELILFDKIKQNHNVLRAEVAALEISIAVASRYLPGIVGNSKPRTSTSDNIAISLVSELLVQTPASLQQPTFT
jgi:hypothetical protein